MPSAANAKSEKAASSEATDNSPIRQIMTIIEHKIRNLEKRKSKLTSYRDLQKAGKELNSDQKVAVAKYDEVAQTLEFARDFSKQVTSIAVVAEREAKKQAKKEAWVRYASDTAKIREVLLILDCLNQMGSSEAREDFLKGTNGACKLTEDDLKVLDDLYPEVTPKHEVIEEGQPGFHIHTTKAAEHLYAIIDGKPKEVLGTTYAHIKEVITAVHECGYFDKGVEPIAGDESSGMAGVGSEGCEIRDEEPEPEPEPAAYAPAPAPLPAPAYPMCPLPPITLQEVEHAYFSQQYPQQRPIAEVIGSQNFFFLQESEIDSPADTPQPLLQPSPPGPVPPAPAPAPIPSQTFTNQHFVQLPGGPHFPPPPELSAFPPVLAPLPPAALHAPEPQPHAPLHPHPHPPPHQPEPADDRKPPETNDDKQDDDWRESRSPERTDAGERKTGQGDGQSRYRRYGRGGRGASNGFRSRGGGFQARQGGDYHGRHAGADNYQSRSGKDERYDKPNRQYSDNYQSRHSKDNYQSRGGADAYYGNGDTTESPQQNENGGRDRDRYNDNQNYQGGFKGRGRGGGRGGARGGSRPPRSHQYPRKSDNVE